MIQPKPRSLYRKKLVLERLASYYTFHVGGTGNDPINKNNFYILICMLYNSEFIFIIIFELDMVMRY